MNYNKSLQEIWSEIYSTPAPNFHCMNIHDYRIKCNEMLKLSPNPEITKIIEDKISLAMMSEVISVDIDVIEKFSHINNSVSHLMNIYSGSKEISIMALGPSGVGKSFTVKNMFGLSDDILKLKGGLQSDNTDVICYTETINGITLKYGDGPGFFDTRGENQIKLNNDRIRSYIESNPLHLLFWMVKITDLPDEKILSALNRTSELFGSNNIWKKTIFVITHACSSPPPIEYFTDASYRESKVAWTNYVDAKKREWKSVLKSITSIDIPVVLVENHPACQSIINGVKCLLDGTPIIESIYDEMFKLLSLNDQCIAFGFLYGEIKKNEIKPLEQIQGDNIDVKHDNRVAVVKVINKQNLFVKLFNNFINFTKGTAIKIKSVFSRN